MVMSVMRAFFSLLGVFFLVAAGPSHAGEADKGRALVQAAVDEGLGTFTSKTYPLDERARLLDSLLRRYSDAELLASGSLGRHWPKLTPAEQAEFTTTFMRYVVSSYVGLLKNLQGGTVVKIGEATEAPGGKVRVSSTVTLPSQPGVPLPVDWDLVTKPDGRLVVVDVTADGISIIRAMKDDFASVLRSSGGKVAPLLDALARKIAENDQVNAAR
ncbi:hypothetical protein A6A04_01875 [Paramagnetospirillum marisnigri]|uniref:Organic solvent ABC transporter n=1 Tax=Paramagnetospirillum marisnigri TaxID=1285242 RepID=A0A178MNK0_9PROT|nr:ABC transporter substrate-binding protein [Paramagnetospirillum marisnigri]OAN50362.1 hypothetical protein A6A04_01875 [Paramagnetospirillum marisnigri]